LYLAIFVFFIVDQINGSDLYYNFRSTKAYRFMLLPTVTQSANLFLKLARITLPLGWVGHIPFAFWITEAVKPAIFVELGTHSGNSYFAFCQSVAMNRLPTQCYAVDTWEGDDHTGFYDNSVFEDVNSYNNKHYPTFSHLLRMTFEQALTHFNDRSIDLLHIDGRHTYDAVKRDFETWLPKISQRGVVLFHDIKVKEREFSRPRKPVNNAFIEIFNRTVRDECLNDNWFLSLEHARKLIKE
jgi:hypothetical protein